MVTLRAPAGPVLRSTGNRPQLRATGSRAVLRSTGGAVRALLPTAKRVALGTSGGAVQLVNRQRVLRLGCGGGTGGGGLDIGGWYLVSDYDGNLANALAAIAADTGYGTLVVDQDVTLAANATVPSTVNLMGVPGATITRGAYDLTVEGPITCGTWQLFETDGAGNLKISGTQTTILPQWFGAFPGSGGCTEGVQAMLDAICQSPYTPSALFGDGDWYLHEVDIPNQYHPLLMGIDVGLTRILYDGDGGDDSYMIRKSQPTKTSAAPWGGFMNMQFRGWNTANDAVPHRGLWLSTAADDDNAMTDWGFKLENIQVLQCLIGIEMGTIVNLHMGRIRFDSIGWDGIKILGAMTQEARPVTIYRGTWDNAASPGATAALRAAGGIAEGAMGRRLVNIEEAHGLTVILKDWRIELNEQLDIAQAGDRPCLVRVKCSTAGGASVGLDDCVGFGNHLQGLVMVWAPNKDVNVRIRSHGFYYVRQGYICDDTTPPISIPTDAFEDINYQSTGSGIHRYCAWLGRNHMGMADHRPDHMVSYTYRKPYDITFRQGTKLVASGIGMSFQSGLTMFAGQTLDIGATTLTCADAELRWLVIDAAIRIPGADAGGADLDTTITDIDWYDNTITFADAVVTAVNDVDITNIPLTWDEVHVDLDTHMADDDVHLTTEQADKLDGLADPVAAPAVYSTDTQQDLPHSTWTLVDFEDEITDDDDLVTTGGSWHYDTPATGLYRVTLQLQVVPKTTPPSQATSATARVYIDGVAYSDQELAQEASDDSEDLINICGTLVLPLTEGDELDVRVKMETGQTFRNTVNGSYNALTIEQVT